MGDIVVDVTKIRDRAAYYKARKSHIEGMLRSDLSPRQRMALQRELFSVAVKAQTPPHSGKE